MLYSEMEVISAKAVGTLEMRKKYANVAIKFKYLALTIDVKSSWPTLIVVLLFQ